MSYSSIFKYLKVLKPVKVRMQKMETRVSESDML